MRNHLCLALIGLLLAGCAGLSTDHRALRVNLVSLDVVEVKLFEQRYAMTLRVQNPNPRALRVTGLDFSLRINGEEFADGVSNQAFTLPAHGEAVAEVMLSSSLFKLFEQLRTLERRHGQGLEYRLKGSVSLDQGWTRLPFERAGKIGFGYEETIHGA